MPRLSILIPYRDRLAHLRQFVPWMYDFFGRSIDFQILVILQDDELLFNRGKLLNVGFSLFKSPSSYFCFHDVDMLPLDDSCDYSEPTAFTHLAGRAEQFGFALPYDSYLDGVLLSTQDEFEKVNGFSNEFWGYGYEDDDLFHRIELLKLDYRRRLGCFRSLPHPKSTNTEANGLRCLRWRHGGSVEACITGDGLDSLRYEVTKTEPLGHYLGIGYAREVDQVVSVRL